MTLYEVLLFVHIVAAIVWVGGAALINVLTTRAARSDDAHYAAVITREVGLVGQRVIAPSTLVLLGMGLWIVGVSEAWTIGQLWIILALVGFGLTFLAGILFFGPEAARIATGIEERGPGDPDVARRIRRITSLSRLDLLLLVLIVADMVFKPGL
jgi:uncharacterized membrane protein